jgi:hypothetical protein
MGFLDRFVAGFCYTQLTDIEQETNGLLTYAREAKVEPAEVAKIHKHALESPNVAMDFSNLNG